MKLYSLSVIVFCALLAAGGCASSSTRITAPTSAAKVGELRPGILNGYLDAAQLPDSLALLPAPPAPGSPAQALDDVTYKTLTQFQGTQRGVLAAQDADLSFPKAADIFSCALGIPLSEKATPNLLMLLRRSMTDAGFATNKAKEAYHRQRPFVVFHAQSCSPGDEAMLAKNGSYPSGHASAGWAWALVLVEVAPDRAGPLLERGRAFGQSRGICGVHWQSDIEAGRLVGAATVARLHASPIFNAQLEAARAEVAEQRRSGAAPATNCTSEAAALATSSLVAP